MSLDPHTARPSERATPPEDVTDRLLWALAVDVAAAHRPSPDGTCGNLQCRGQRGPCWALRTAHRAQQVVRRAPSVAAKRREAVRADVPLPRQRGARGRAAVPPAAGGFTGWFTPAATPATTSTTWLDTADRHRHGPVTAVLAAA